MNFLNSIRTLLLALVLSIGISYAYAAWAPPSTTPTGGNTDAPINVGSATQLKDGGLGLGRAGFPALLDVVGNLVVSGNVGIGTAAPSTKLHVSSNTDTELSVESTAVGGRRWTLQSSATGGLAGVLQIVDRTGEASRLSIDTSGNVGIGTVSPSAKLDVAGAVRVGDTSTCTAGAIRFRSNDFEGCVDGTTWKSLTTGGAGCASGSWSRSTPGTYTFTIGTDTPSCVTNLNTIQLWGGGGGGASGTSNWGSSGGGGGGGGFGQAVNYAVTSGATFTVVVGGGGIHGERGGDWNVCTGGQNGGPSSFGPFTAGSGSGGVSGVPDYGNSTTSCNGGAPGSASGPGIIPTAGNGGAGGSFGDFQTGGNGGAGANGGAGGSGAGYGGVAGPSTPPGGGGGGGFSGSGTDGVRGGDGAPGQVEVTW